MEFHGDKCDLVIGPTTKNIISFKTLFLATSYNLALANMKFGFNEGQVVECQCQCHLSLPKHTVQG